MRTKDFPNILYGSFRVRLRVSGDSGACGGFFTYRSDEQEIDIELLSKDPRNLVHYTNHPSNTKDAASLVDLHDLKAGLTWSGWHTHRLDWTSSSSSFYLDSIYTASNKGSVPNEPSHFMLNVWNDNGDWTGEMKTGDSAKMEVGWIEMFYNTTESAQTVCARTCPVDKGLAGGGRPGTKGIGGGCPVGGDWREAGKCEEHDGGDIERRIS